MNGPRTLRQVRLASCKYLGFSEWSAVPIFWRQDGLNLNGPSYREIRIIPNNCALKFRSVVICCLVEKFRSFRQHEVPVRKTRRRRPESRPQEHLESTYPPFQLSRSATVSRSIHRRDSGQVKQDFRQGGRHEAVKAVNARGHDGVGHRR